MESETYSFGYCTNVHAGTTLEQAQANLLRFAEPVRQRIGADRLPIGLWLAEPAVNSLIAENGVKRFADWLHLHHFTAYTFNGFPQGDFHQPVVKHAVYEPTWTCDSRTRYTLGLAEILDALLPTGGLGSISTLPLGWPHAPWHAENFKNAADHLLQVAKFLDRLAQASGKQVLVALEPEPGCVLNTAEELVEFFEHYLFSGPDQRLARQYLSVCHDVCHSGVMFESQTEALERYRQAGIRVGKVQVSAAVHVPWDEYVGDLDRQSDTARQLRELHEPRYLHQVTQRGPSGALDKMIEDLPLALSRWLPAEGYPDRAWRIHFHVPIFVDPFGSLRTTQAEIQTAVDYLSQHQHQRVGDAAWFSGHYEVETYAWPVLPPELAEEDLAAGIAREMQYFEGILTHVSANG